MSDNGNKFPALPSNYVTLAQLQERWLKEQERKQREKEEEEGRRSTEKEKEDRKHEDQEYQKTHTTNGVTCKANAASSHRPFRKSRRNQSEKSSKPVVELKKSASSHRSFQENRLNQSDKGSKPIGELKDAASSRSFQENPQNQSEKSSKPIGEPKNAASSHRPFQKNRQNQSEIISNTIGEPKIDESKKQHGKRRKNKRKPRAEKNSIGSTEKPLPEQEAVEEKIPEVLTERGGQKEWFTDEPQRNGKTLAVNVKVWKKKVPEDLRLRIRDTLSDRKGGNERYNRNVHGGQNGRGSRGFDDRKMKEPMDADLVWVRKGDTTDVPVAGNYSCGALAKAGETQKKPAQRRP